MTDFVLYGDGPLATLFRLTPLSDTAKEWIEEHVNQQQGFQPTWPELFVEHGYLDDLVGGIIAAGMTVDGSASGAVTALGRGE